MFDSALIIHHHFFFKPGHHSQLRSDRDCHLVYSDKFSSPSPKRRPPHSPQSSHWEHGSRHRLFHAMCPLSIHRKYYGSHPSHSNFKVLLFSCHISNHQWLIKYVMGLTGLSCLYNHSKFRHCYMTSCCLAAISFTLLQQTWGHFRQQTVLPPRKSRPSEEYIVLKGNYSRLAWLHLRLQVRLVADEEDHSVGVGQVARVCQPGGKVVVSRPVNKIILGNIFSTWLVMKLL